MTKKHFFTASAIALSMALSGTAFALDVDVNGNQVSDDSGQSADDGSNISTTGALADHSYNGGNTTTKTDSSQDNDTFTSTKNDNDTATLNNTKNDNDTTTLTNTKNDNDTKNVASGNTVASNNNTTLTKNDNDTTTVTKNDNDTTTKSDNDTVASNNTVTTTATKNDNDTTSVTKNDNDTKNVASFNTKNDNDTTTKNDNDVVHSYNQDNDTTTKNDNDVVTSTNVIASQDLKGVIVNIGVKEIVDAGDTGVNTGDNSVAGSAFAAYAGILNAAWNTGINSNAQAATNISAQGNVTFGSVGAAPAGTTAP